MALREFFYELNVKQGEARLTSSSESGSSTRPGSWRSRRPEKVLGFILCSSRSIVLKGTVPGRHKEVFLREGDENEENANDGL